MKSTKDEIARQIIDVLAQSGKSINPSVITQKLNWNKDFINEICDLFAVQKFSEILKQIPEIEINKNGKTSRQNPKNSRRSFRGLD